MAGISENCNSEVCISNESTTTVMEDGAVRMSKLRSALEKTTKACISTLSYDVFTAHFKPKSREEKKMLRDISSQFREKATELVKDEIVLMIREENVAQMLSKLEELCHSSSQCGKRWRPTGVPVDDTAGHLLPVLMVLRKKLKFLLHDVEAEADRMMRAVLERRRLVHNLKAEIVQNAKLLCQDSEMKNVLLQK